MSLFLIDEKKCKRDGICVAEMSHKDHRDEGRIFDA